MNPLNFYLLTATFYLIEIVQFHPKIFQDTSMRAEHSNSNTQKNKNNGQQIIMLVSCNF
jgi:hypothetical protein